MSLPDRTFQELLDDLAAPLPSAGGGAAAATALALAASVVVMAARTAPAWEDAEGVAAQAGSLRARIVELAEIETEVFPRAMAELAAPTNDYRLRDALTAAADAPLRLAEVAADVAELTRVVAEHAEPGLQADLVVARHLAAGAACGCAHLVRANLTVTDLDERAARADAAAADAAR